MEITQLVRMVVMAGRVVVGAAAAVRLWEIRPAQVEQEVKAITVELEKMTIVLLVAEVVGLVKSAKLQRQTEAEMEGMGFSQA